MQENLLNKNQTDFGNLREAVAESRISYGNKSALALRDALIEKKSKNEILWGLYNRLKLCSFSENHWIGEDLHSEETGECFQANGVKWGCGSKLCPNCVAKLSKRSRNELQLALKNYKLQTGENFQFITYTIPNPDLSLIETRNLLNDIHTLYRKRKYVIEHIRGASKSEEFTITENGYHYHYHHLAVTRFLSFERIRKEWTDCARIVFKRYNIAFEPKTKDGLLLVKIKKIVSSRNGLKGAIQEVCKYVTKSDSWEKIPQKDLIEVSSIERFPRMFELLGSFKTNRNINSVLDCLHPFLTYLVLKTVFLMFQKLKEKIEIGEHYTILDTKEISDGENSGFDEVSGTSPPRSLNWRKHIEVFGLKDYLKRLTGEFERACEWRESALRYRYPFASFKTFDGEAF